MLRKLLPASATLVEMSLDSTSGGGKRSQIRRETVVEQRAGTTFPDPLDHLRSRHSQFVENQTGDQRRAVEAQAAVRQDAVARLHNGCTKRGDGMQFIQVR